MKPPLVSLIMPVYNHEVFLERSVGSIIDQDYKNWELIVIDDGSSDSSSAIIKNFKDPRIHYYYQSNQGVINLAKTINRGLDLAVGELVTMVPSDDSWPRNRLSIQVPKMMNSEIALSYGQMNLIDEKDKIIGFADPEKSSSNLNNSPKGSILKELLVENFIGEPTVLIRKCYLEEIGGYIQPKGMLAEDYPTILHLVTKGQFIFIPKVLANYRFHSSQMTRIHLVDMVKKDKEFILKYFDQLSPKMVNISGWTKENLSNYWDEKVCRSYFSLGRRQAYSKKRKDARDSFRKCFFQTNALELKLISLLALVSNFFGQDIEWMKFFNRDVISLGE